MTEKNSLSSFALIITLLLMAAIILAGCVEPIEEEGNNALDSTKLEDEPTKPGQGDDAQVLIFPIGRVGGEDDQPDWKVSPDDDNLMRGEAFINENELVALETQPPQYMLVIEGALPTPCHHLRIKIADPDIQNHINVEVYSVADPLEICVQVLEAFDVEVPVDVYPSGEYTVWVNDERIGMISY